MTNTAVDLRSPAADVARSWLLWSADTDLDPASSTGADQIILDLEDAIDASRKASCRRGVADWLSARGEAWVRINSRGSQFWDDDLDELRGLPGLRGVMLAKAEEASDVRDTYERLERAVPVIALVESALGIENAAEIARAEGTFRLAFGSGDYRRDTGTSADDLALAYPRSRLVVASRVGNLPGPIDGPSVGLRDDALRQQCQRSVALGLTGKLSVEPSQVDVVNDGFSPSHPDIAWAVQALADFEGRGRVVRDGSDLPRIGRAERIVELAQAFRLIER